MQRINKKARVIISSLLLLLLLTGIVVSRQPLTTHAAGDAYFILSPSSGSYTVGSSFNLLVYEDSQSSDNVEGVQANVSYSASNLQFNSVSESGSPFTYLGQSTGGSGSVAVGEASGSTVSGQQLVATINFTVIGTNTPNPTSVSITSGSDIQNSSETSVWNSALTNASFTLSQPTQSSSNSSSGSGSSSSSGSGSSSKTSSSSSKSSSPSSSSSSGSSKSSSTSTTPSTTTTTAAVSPITYLSITITDSQGKPLAGAKVSLDNKTSTLTNKNGAVIFSAVTSGTHTVSVSDPGKKSTQTQLSISSGENKLISLKLANNSSGSAAILLALVAGFIIVIGGGGYWYLKIFRKDPTIPSDNPPANSKGLGLAPNSTAPTTVVLPEQPKNPTQATDNSKTFNNPIDSHTNNL